MSTTPPPFKHPTTLLEFEQVYKTEYEQELESCARWIKWCEKHHDTHGVSFHEGMRGALIFHNIKMCQLLRVLKQEAPNAAPRPPIPIPPKPPTPREQG